MAGISKAEREKRAAEQSEHPGASAPGLCVPMKRELQEGESGPTTADVHPDEVEAWSKHGWQVVE